MSEEIPQSVLENLASRFEHQGQHVYGSPNMENSSPLYAHLSVTLAGNPDILVLG